MPIRLAVPLLAAAIACCALPAAASAQAAHAGLGVSAVILPAAPVARVFVRVDAGTAGRNPRAFVAQPQTREATLPRALPIVAHDSVVRIERLIIAGT